MPDFDLRLGRWQDVLADVECDALIFDAPYGERTHRGHDAAAEQQHDMTGAWSRPLGYSWLTPEDVREIVDHWSPRTRGWFCTMTSHDLVPAWETALEQAGRYVFAPLPVLDFHRPRLIGDGPGSCMVHMIVARPRNTEFSRWGSLPSRYDRPQGEGRAGRRMGGKSLITMRAIVRDYSRPGDLVCDPFAGFATTLRAALEEGRRAVGSEVDPEAYALGLARLQEPCSAPMFGDAIEGEQGGLPGFG